MKELEFTPEEIGYLLGLLAAHLEYYRTLAGSPKCTDQNRSQHQMLETLAAKLR